MPIRRGTRHMPMDTASRRCRTQSAGAFSGLGGTQALSGSKLSGKCCPPRAQTRFCLWSHAYQSLKSGHQRAGRTHPTFHSPWAAGSGVYMTTPSTLLLTMLLVILPGGSDSKESARSGRDPGSIPGSGRSPGEANGNALQYSCLENSMDREAWWATVCEVARIGWLSS